MIALPLYFAPLCVWSVTRYTILQSDAKLNQSRLGHSCRTGSLVLLTVLLGSLGYFLSLWLAIVMSCIYNTSLSTLNKT